MRIFSGDGGRTSRRVTPTLQESVAVEEGHPASVAKPSRIQKSGYASKCNILLLEPLL